MEATDLLVESSRTLLEYKMLGAEVVILSIIVAILFGIYRIDMKRMEHKHSKDREEWFRILQEDRDKCRNILEKLQGRFESIIEKQGDRLDSLGNRIDNISNRIIDKFYKG